MKRWAFAVLAVAAVGGCSSRNHSSAPVVTADNYLSQFVDTTTSPRQDIFQFAVGKWLKDHPIPTSERSWGIGKVVQDETYRRLVAIDPFDREAEAQLGRLALKRKDPLMAVRSFKSVLGSNPPDRAQAHVELAEAHLAAGQYADAKKQTLAALEIAPSFERAQDLLLKISDTAK